jgi:hypothetical protein
MSLYHDDPVVDDLILTIINDGNGSQCGMTYENRKSAAFSHDLAPFRIAARKYSTQRVKAGGSPATRSQIIEAANYLMHYYTEHNAECQQ